MKRSRDSDFYIDKKPLLNPDCGVEYSSNSLISNDSGRDESGYMHLITIRDGVRKWSFSYSILTEEEYRYLTYLIPKGKMFNFTFRNDNGIPETAVCYCNQIGVAFYSRSRGVYKNLKFEVVEA